MKISLQTLIDKRVPLDNNTIENIIHLFSEHQRINTKRVIKNLLLNKFYTIFDGHVSARAIYIDSNEIHFIPYTKNGLIVSKKYCRDYILSFDNVDYIWLIHQ
jgi:hypothetical protein